MVARVYVEEGNDNRPPSVKVQKKGRLSHASANTVTRIKQPGIIAPLNLKGADGEEKMVVARSRRRRMNK